MARPRSNFPRKLKRWDSIDRFALDITGDATSLGAAKTFTEPSTVMRMLGEYTIGPTSAPAALDAVSIGIGIALVSGDAAALGATAMPDPLDEPAYPWLFWADHWLEFGTTSADPSAAEASLRRPFDIRSMRKMKPRESLVVVVQYLNSVGNPPINVAMSATRLLLAVS